MNALAIILISAICLLSLILVIVSNQKVAKSEEIINSYEKDLLVKDKIHNLQSIPVLPTDNKRAKRRKRRANRKMERVKKLNNF